MIRRNPVRLRTGICSRVPIVLLVLFCLSVCSTSLTTVQAEDGVPAEPPANETTVALRDYLQSVAERFHFTLTSPGRSELTFVAEPVQRWTAENIAGGVWIWTSAGRPELIACFGTYAGSGKKWNTFHEWHSLSRESFADVKAGSRWTWRCQQPGLQFKEFPAADAPAENDRLRLAQMRSLAKLFQGVQIEDQREDQLRLSPTPIYRYAAAQDGKVDGAIFSMLGIRGTDPELLIVIEASDLTKPGAKFRYAPARFSWRPLRLKLNDELVWEVTTFNEQWRSLEVSSPYITCPGEEINLDRLPRRKTE